MMSSLDELTPITVIFVVYLLLITNITAEQINCDNVSYTFAEKGLNVHLPSTSKESKEDHTVREHDVNRAVLDGLVTVCGNGPCCNENMQQQISYHSKKQFETALSQTLGSLSTLLQNRAHKYDVIFKQMMVNAKSDFHEMFKKTYGIIYEQNSYVFTDLFEELEKYYTGGQVDLTEAMDNFFTTLYQKMFTVLNAQYHFTDWYLQCVSERMKELRPFGDVPAKLTAQLKRSFVATRTFSQALIISSSVVNNMQKLSMTPSCIRAVAKMTHCPACSGLKEIKPCSNYCSNVMKGCLAYHSQLDSHWNTFIDATDELIGRLLGPFNIEVVVEPINIKISEAIMNFQENAQQVSQRVFSECGKVELGKRRRRNTGEIPFETLHFNNNNHNKNNRRQGNQPDGLEKVIRETRSRLKDSKHFWQKLPYHMCGTSVAEQQDSCWNGEKRDKYEPAVVGDGMSNQQNNPEVVVDINRPNSLVNEQIYALKTITSKLKSAYKGMDVEWIDTEEMFDYGSGSGFGWTEPGSGLSPSGGEPEPIVPDQSSPEPPTSGNEEDNHLYPIPDSPIKSTFNSSEENNETGAANQLTINRMLISFLIPTFIVMWYGSSFFDCIK
uniref:Putative heparin sulfate cell surface proteoglycan n=1 Tax=Panstrongylus lignarius TaxID=156445 RepID=A0A224XLT2_9HEMI